jgi:hypothetical protein
MPSQKCPSCGLYNSEAALRCDCGYDFVSGQMKASYLSDTVVMQTKGAIWVHATWITAFLEAAFLVILLVLSTWLKVGEVDGSFVVWALVFGGLGLGVLRGNRRSAWWLVIVQWFWAARIAISVLMGVAVPLYFLMLFTGALVVSTVGATHLERTFKLRRY